MSKSLPFISMLLAGLLAADAVAAWYWPFGPSKPDPPKKPEVPSTGRFINRVQDPKDKIYPKQPDHSGVSVDKVKQLADDGNPNAQLTLGKIYFDGLVGEKQDYRKAFKYFQLAAENGNPEGMYNLGVCYEGGFGLMRPDKDKAMKWYEASAEAGVSMGQRKAAAFAESHGKADIAFKYYKMLADDRDADCMYHVAVCMLNGYGTNVDPEGAVAYLLQAAESGHTRSQVRLADCYHQGTGVGRDYNEMANWLMVAAHSGDPEAQAKLGMCYQTARGVERNDELAFKWYKAGAEVDFVDALYLLGNCYRDAVGTSKDEKKALDCYRRAAEQGDSLSQLEVAEAYRNGRGVVADIEEALVWYRKAAENGLGLAQARLGALLATGTEKTAANPAEGEKWLQKALEGRQPLAVVQVALCYLNGEGVAMDREHARRILADASARGSREAQAIYELYFLNTSPAGDEKK